MIIETAPRLWYTGLVRNDGRFKKGLTPWNTGTKGVMKPNRTSFQKGHGFVPVLERLMAKIQKTNSCWLWTASLNNQGYGRLGMKGQNRSKLAHRLMYEEVVGPTNGLCVLHKCDNPRCVNPDHLFLGTQYDNAQDRISKGRSCKGEKAPWSKLTNMQIDRIRSLYATGAWTQRDLAKVFDISQPNLCQIVNNRIWKV